MKAFINKFVSLAIISLLAIITLTACASKPSGTYVFEKMILESSGVSAIIKPSDISDTYISGLESFADAGIEIETESFKKWADVWIRGVAERKYIFTDDEVSVNKNHSEMIKFRMDGNRIILLDDEFGEIITEGVEMTFKNRKVVLRNSDIYTSQTVYYKKA